MALCLASPATFAQQSLNVTIKDSKSPNYINSATVEELAGGQTLVTDIEGSGEFPNEVSGDIVTIFKVSAQGFPNHYFQRIWPDLGPDYGNETNQVFGLTQANEYMTPILGPSGGSKTINLPTGILVYSGPSDPNPVEYAQSFSATLPAGALSGNYRAGLSFIPGAGQSENNVNLQQLGEETQVAAQFAMEWLDTSGNPIISPVMAQPLRIEMGASTYILDQEFPGSWNVSLYKFDESNLTWIAMPTGASGMDSTGKLWADIRDSGYYSFMAWDSALVISSLCTTEWVEEKWYGADEDESDVTCSGGAEQHLNLKYGKTDSTKVTGSASGSLSAKLKLMGLKSEASVELGVKREDHWGTFQEKDYGWDAGAYTGFEGTIYLRAKGYVINLRKICINGETGEEEINLILETEGPIKTGYSVRKELTACP